MAGKKQVQKSTKKATSKKRAPSPRRRKVNSVDAPAKEEANKKRIQSREAFVKTPLIIRDPVHDLIRIDCPIAARLIQTEPFQRLRRIKQLGLASMVYPGAEHTRFNHSLGVYHLAHEAMDAIDRNLEGMGREPRFTNNACEGMGFYYRKLVGLAALLHDVGHGPFSHMFERVGKDILKQKVQDHEKWTVAIIKNHEEVCGILKEFNDRMGSNFSELNKERKERNEALLPVPDVFEDLSKIYEHTYLPDFVTDLISSQMDVDRFDYLMRDSRNAGCHYGDFDIRWIFRSLLVIDVDPKRLSELSDATGDLTADTGKRQVLAVIEDKGRNCVEEYILGRHYMYVHLYYHKTIVGAEGLLQRILKRAVIAIASGELEGHFPVLASFAENENPPIEDYLYLDDHVVLGWVSAWAKGIGCRDETLVDLASRLARRDLFSKVSPPSDRREFAEKREKVKEEMNRSGFDPDYYFIETTLSDTAHKDFLYYLKKGKPEDFRDIQIYNPTTSLVLNLSQVRESVVVKGAEALVYDDFSWYVPRQFLKRAKEILGSS